MAYNLTALLNVCWEEEFIPADWMDGIVVPLHKKRGGDSCDIGNYVGNNIRKPRRKGVLFSVNARLSEAMESKILGEAQGGGGGGFRRNRRTTDQVFVVSGIAWANKKRPRQENLDGVLRL